MRTDEKIKDLKTRNKINEYQEVYLTLLNKIANLLTRLAGSK